MFMKEKYDKTLWEAEQLNASRRIDQIALAPFPRIQYWKSRNGYKSLSHIPSLVCGRHLASLNVSLFQSSP